MCRVQDYGGGRFVDLPRLDPHEAVLDHVDPAHPVEAAQPVQLLDERNAPTLPSPGGGGNRAEADRNAPFEGQLDDRGSGGGGVAPTSPPASTAAGGVGGWPQAPRPPRLAPTS